MFADQIKDLMQVHDLASLTVSTSRRADGAIYWAAYAQAVTNSVRLCEQCIADEPSAAIEGSIVKLAAARAKDVVVPVLEAA